MSSALGADVPVQPEPVALTTGEKVALIAFLRAGMDCNGATTVEAMLADNMTWMDAADLAKALKASKKAAVGFIGSLAKKNLIVAGEEPVNSQGAVQQVLTDAGVRLAFALLNEARDEQKATPKKDKPAPNGDKKPAERKPRVLEDRVLVQPTDDLDRVKAVVEGSKRAILLTTLVKDGGTTVEELMAALGWNRDTVTSAFSVDVKATGMGVERKGGRLFLLLPKGLKAIPVAAKGQTRAAAVAECR